MAFQRIQQFDLPIEFSAITREPNFARNSSGGKISVTILVSTLDYFNEKLMTKFFKKSKNPEKALSVFKYSNYLPSCQKSEKAIEPLLRKTQNGHHRRTY